MLDGAVDQAISTIAPTDEVVFVIDSAGTDFKLSQNYKRLDSSFRR